MSRANSEVHPTLVGALVGGVQAAIELGEQLSGDDCADLYLSATSFEELGSKIEFVELRRALPPAGMP